MNTILIHELPLSDHLYLDSDDHYDIFIFDIFLDIFLIYYIFSF